VFSTVINIFFPNVRSSEFRNNRFEVVKGTEGLNITYMYKDNRGNLGLVNDNLLKKLKKGGTEIFNLKNIPGNLSKNIVFEDQNGILWMGSVKGLWRICRGGIRIITKEQGLTEGPVRKIYEDREGNLWVGSRLGLSRIKNPRLVTYSSEEGLGSDFPRSIYQDSRGCIWIRDDSSNITKIMPTGHMKVYSYQNLLPKNLRGSFHENREDIFWSGPGMSIFQDGKFVPFKRVKGLHVNATRAILKDKAGRWWLGTYEGFVLLEDGEAATFTIENGLSDNMILELMQAGDGALWIGTNRGLTIYKDGIFRAVKSGTGISQKQVLEIYIDQEGVVWLGTYGGLCCYRGGHFFLYTMKHGLVDNAILGILKDDEKNLWMSSNHGIFYVNEKELYDLVEGGIHTLNPVTFGKADGMKIEECNGSGYPSCWKTRDGRLWFPTMKGVVVADPKRVQLNTQPPPVFIGQVLLDGKEAPADESGIVTVLPGIKRIGFQFTAIDFHNPKKVRFRFQLAGHDGQWVEPQPGGDRIAHYMNVPGGTYTFRVIACQIVPLFFASPPVGYLTGNDPGCLVAHTRNVPVR
jgi:ligand-binding sensor domain-containing protein